MRLIYLYKFSKWSNQNVVIMCSTEIIVHYIQIIKKCLTKFVQSTEVYHTSFYFFMKLTNIFETKFSNKIILFYKLNVINQCVKYEKYLRTFYIYLIRFHNESCFSKYL